MTLDVRTGPLRLAVPFRSGTLAAAQFPTLWGDVTRPARYLDLPPDRLVVVGAYAER